jgi:hypothetical protein
LQLSASSCVLSPSGDTDLFAFSAAQTLGLGLRLG